MPSFYNLIVLFVIIQSAILVIQGIITLFWMLYAWDNPEEVAEYKSPKEFLPPKHSFTAIIPARNEEQVIADTISAVDKINYPSELKEILIVCRDDDARTISEVQKLLLSNGTHNIRLVVLNGSFPINKPHSLNHGLREAKGDVVAIFDAEDEPHADIYSVINTVLLQKKCDVVQSGVQLMNYRSHWFATLNVMEYFLWFKSGLHFFTKVGKVTPLGGNTVFVKRDWLTKVGGWDETCLTEDADIGFRLTLAGAKTHVIYDEKHATREETPATIGSFIKQRTRWNQGFLQIFRKGDWKKLPSSRQRLFAAYILLSPEIITTFFLYTPIGTWIALTTKLPVLVTQFSFLPLALFTAQILVIVIGLYEFTKAYKLKFPFWMPAKVLITIYPYLLVLMFSSFRAFYRMVFNINDWEKTEHVNAHRELAELNTYE